MNYTVLKKITEQLKADGNDVNIFSVIFEHAWAIAEDKQTAKNIIQELASVLTDIEYYQEREIFPKIKEYDENGKKIEKLASGAFINNMEYYHEDE